METVQSLTVSSSPVSLKNERLTRANTRNKSRFTWPLPPAFTVTLPLAESGMRPPRKEALPSEGSTSTSSISAEVVADEKADRVAASRPWALATA